MTMPTELHTIDLHLAEHAAGDEREASDRDFIRSFIAAHPDCRSRHCAPGHLTGSAFLLHPDGASLLLIHHRKLGRWLQPGGHMQAEDADPLATALREAREETGLSSLRPADRGPLDVDVHRIPARLGEDAHDHLDFRYAIWVEIPEEAIACQQETMGMRWFSWDDIDAGDFDPAFRRAALKARAMARVSLYGK